MWVAHGNQKSEETFFPEVGTRLKPLMYHLTLTADVKELTSQTVLDQEALALGDSMTDPDFKHLTVDGPLSLQSTPVVKVMFM